MRDSNSSRDSFVRAIENEFPDSWSTTFRAKSLAVDAVIPKVFLLQAVLSPKKLPGSVLVRICSRLTMKSYPKTDEMQLRLAGHFRLLGLPDPGLAQGTDVPLDRAARPGLRVAVLVARMGRFPYTPRQLSQVGVFECLTGI